MNRFVRRTAAAWTGVMGMFFSAGASAAVVVEVEGNDTVATAQNVDAAFSLDFRDDVGDTVQNTSTMFPHATIEATGDDTFDYFSFTVAPGVTKLIFDVDHTSSTAALQPFDTKIFLYDSGGGFHGDNDNALAISDGALGSASLMDSYLEVLNPTPGLYAIGIARDDAIPLDGHIGGSPTKAGDVYTIHVSQTPEPSAALIALVAAGCTALTLRRRRRTDG